MRILGGEVEGECGGGKIARATQAGVRL